MRLALLLALFLSLPSIALAGDCKRTSSVCIDASPYKVISGVTITLAEVGGCWVYEDTYVCLKPNAVDYCAPLIAAGCWQTSARCTQTDTLFGTGCMTQINTYRCADPSMPTPPNTIRLAETYTLVSSDYDRAPCSSITANPMCYLAESRCVQTTPDSPLPPGISPTEVAPDGCYRREDIYTCMTGRNDMGCAEYAANPDCTLLESKCDDEERANGQCLSTTKMYRCIEKRGATKTITDCGTQQFCFNGACFDTGFTPDSDFAQVVTYMEAMREAGTYIDEGGLRLFKGIDSRCTRKALVNCCKAKSGGAPNNMTYAKVLLDAAGAAYDYLRSPYMYDALFMSSAPDWMLRSLYGASSPMNSTIPSISYYGFTAQFGSTTPVTSWFGEKLGVDAITIWSNSTNTFALTFDPVSFAIQLAVSYVLEDLMSCDQSDILTGMRKGNNLCHYIGDYCSSRFLGKCIERKETYCCYNSRLAKIINVEGRKQIAKGWGTASSPDCTGFTPAELQSIDFSRMDLSQFAAEIVPKDIDIEKVRASIQNRIVTNPAKSYFNETTP